jgi:hypothetical protein
MIVYEILVVLLLIAECWLIYHFSNEHTVMMEIIAQRLHKIEQRMR